MIEPDWFDRYYGAVKFWRPEKPEMPYTEEEPADLLTHIRAVLARLDQLQADLDELKVRNDALVGRMEHLFDPERLAEAVMNVKIDIPVPSYHYEGNDAAVPSLRTSYGLLGK